MTARVTGSTPVRAVLGHVDRRDAGPLLQQVRRLGGLRREWSVYVVRQRSGVNAATVLLSCGLWQSSQSSVAPGPPNATVAEPPVVASPPGHDVGDDRWRACRRPYSGRCRCAPRWRRTRPCLRCRRGTCRRTRTTVAAGSRFAPRSVVHLVAGVASIGWSCRRGHADPYPPLDRDPYTMCGTWHIVQIRALRGPGRDTAAAGIRNRDPGAARSCWPDSS